MYVDSSDTNMNTIAEFTVNFKIDDNYNHNYLYKLLQLQK